jgi:hypothetical protein
MDEIRGAGKAVRKAYSYTVTESQGPRNKEVRHLRRYYIHYGKYKQNKLLGQHQKTAEVTSRITGYYPRRPF